MTDKLEQWLQRYLESGALRTGGRRLADDPSALQLYRYLNDQMEGEELEKMLSYLKGNTQAQELVLKARELMESPGGWEKEEVPPGLLGSAQGLMGRSQSAPCPYCGKKITPFKKPRKTQFLTLTAWGLAAAGSFALSFVVHRYFMQFLAAAFLAGVKLIVEARAAKTQIMIFKALSEDEAKGGRLHSHSSRL